MKNILKTIIDNFYKKGAAHLDTPPSIAKDGFTLAEVLITLGIIGVVAAMTIPNLMTAIKAYQMRAQYLKSYAIVQQVFRQMIADEIDLDPKSYGLDKFYQTFAQYLKGTIDCGTNAKGMKSYPQCYTKTSPRAYRNYSNTTKAYTELFDDGQLILMDGTNLLFENQSGNQIFVHVDINGFQKPPNRWGYDLFTFEFLNGELRTMGATGTRYTDLNTYCSKSSGHNYNGIACADKAKTNSEYFKEIAKELK